MVVLRFRNESDTKDVLKKLKKMHKFTKELLDCMEEKYEDEDYDDDTDYRHDYDDYESDRPHIRNYRSRYRRSM